MAKKSDKLPTSIALFEGKRVRHIWHEDRWWFSIIDVIEVLQEKGETDGRASLPN